MRWILRLERRSSTDPSDTGSVAGTSSDGSGSVLTFSPINQWQRPGLLLWDGAVYVAFGSHEDQTPYHGWIFGYNASTLAQTVVYCTTPNGTEGGIWQGGVGLALIPTLDIFTWLLATEPWTQIPSKIDYGDSVLKLDTANQLAVLDYFSPSNQASLSSAMPT